MLVREWSNSNNMVCSELYGMSLTNIFYFFSLVTHPFMVPVRVVMVML